MGFFSGGATKAENDQINQNRAQIDQNRSWIYGQGQNLNDQAGNRGNAYFDQAQQATQQANQAYAPLIAGQGGYTPEQAAAIENNASLGKAGGNPYAGITSADELTGNYLTAGDAQAIHGDQSGIQAGLGQVNEAADTLANNTRLSQQGQDQIATDAARSATNVDHAAMDANAERARAAGMDPLGVAGYTAQADRRSQQDAANAASAARVNAMQVAAGRENNIYAAKANAAGTNLGAQQQMEGNMSQRAAMMALNRQQTAEGNQATNFNQQQQANQGVMAGQQYIDTNQAARAATVANQNQGQAAEGRQYLQNQIGGNNAAAQTEQGIQSGVYGTTTQGVNQTANEQAQNTQNQITANNRSSGFNNFLNAASGMAQAGAKAYASDRRLKENIVLLGQLNGVNIYEYSFIGNPAREVGVMAQEAYERFPDDVIVGGEDPNVSPWMVKYSTLVPKLLAA